MIWALVLLPALAGVALLGLGGRGRPGAAAVATAAVTLGLALMAGGETARFAWAPGFALTVALPSLAQTLAVLLPAVALPILAFAAVHEETGGKGRLFGTLLLFMAGMELVIVASDLVTLLIGWEIVGACSWALIGHRRREEAPGRSANHAFVMTRAGDLGLFLALFVTVSQTGGAGYHALGTLEGPALGLATAGILVAAAAKAGQLPFAPWLFRAMDGPVHVSALLHSATMVAAGVYLLARLHPWLGPVTWFGPAAMALGLATALAGGVVALRQIHAKKVLAGSTSAQMGLMVAAVGAGFPGVAILHLVVHAATKAALFLATGIAHGAAGSYDLRRMGLGRALPLAAGLTALAALSLAAVPPLSGGWSKEGLLRALEHAGPWWGAVALAAGGLSAAYALRFVWMAYGPGEGAGAARRGEVAALGALSAAVVALSALWLPSVHGQAAAALGADLPEGTRAGLIASLAAMGIGALAGLRMARAPGRPPRADWLGLPALIDALVARPFARLAGWAARADDRTLDGIPRGAAALARRAARGAARADDRWIDGLVPGAADRAGAGGVRVWRGGVGLAVAATGALARAASIAGEALADIIPGGSGRAVGMAGADVRRAQTGLAHHYYAILVAGATLAIALLVFGA